MTVLRGHLKLLHGQRGELLAQLAHELGVGVQLFGQLVVVQVSHETDVVHVDLAFALAGHQGVDLPLA